MVGKDKIPSAIPSKPDFWWDVVVDNLQEHEMYTFRAKVPGGWMVKTFSLSAAGRGPGGAFFYPDPNHEWDGKTLS